MEVQISNLKTQILSLLGWSVIAVLLQVAWAEAASLTATVDRYRITVEDQVLYTLTVEGARDATPPTLPELGDFQVQQGGTSSQISIVNGAISQSIKFNYILIPKREGEFILPPATLVHQGQTLQSQPIKILVQKSSSAIPSGQNAAPPEEDSSRSLFVRTSVSRPTPYENQQVVYSFRLYRQVDIANANLELPEFKGFWVEDLGKQEEFSENINGVPFQVTEIKKALFPQKPGPLAIPPALLQCDVLVPMPDGGGRDSFGQFFNDPLFNRFMGRQKSVRKNLRSEETAVTVQSLPSAGKPPDFKPLVGSFALQATMEKEELEVGGSNTITIVAEGDGNVQDIQVHFRVDEDLFKVYDDLPTVEKLTEGGRLAGRKTYKKAFVPLREGPLSLPPVELDYFDPDTGEYRTLRATLKPMRVLEPKDKETLALAAPHQDAVEKKKIKVIAKDIFPIYTGMDFHEGHLDDKSFWIFIALILILPSGFFLGAFLMIRAREKTASGSGRYRSRRALSQAEKKLKDTESLAQPDQAQEFFSRVSRIVKEYVGDKIDTAGASLTAAEMGDILRGRGVTEEILAEVVSFLERCEAGCFAPQGAAGEELRTFPQTAHTLMKKLEKKLR